MGKTKQKYITYAEARERGEYAVKIGLATQIAAVIDVLQPTQEQLCEMMELSMQYNENMEMHYNHLEDIAERIFDATKIDIHIGRESNRNIYMPKQYEYVKKQRDDARLQLAALTTKYNRLLKELEEKYVDQ